MDTKVIAFFNNKGGVSKTTSCYHIGWKLAEMGKRVVAVDLDPQCNLTGLCLVTNGIDLVNGSEKQREEPDVHKSLLPVMKSLGSEVLTPDLVPVEGIDNFWLLPGNVKMAEIETQLATALSVGSSMPAMQNLPGSFSHLYALIAKRYDADYILLDMSPSFGAVNRVNLMSSDFFIVPTMPDIFSVMALESLARTLPEWKAWADKTKAFGIYDDEDILYKFVPKTPKFLGTIIQKYKNRNGVPTAAFKVFFHQLEIAIAKSLYPNLAKVDMALDQERYEEVMDEFKLAQVSDFNTLIAVSQDQQKPTFKLQKEDLLTWGKAAETQLETIEQFDTVFTELAERVLELTK
ncbi:ParA family protein [Corynebacterium sp. ACRPH]|uniref:ParA family protein n=1 Tax=Corynebacterium sp. ACRPH TaxID=2918199 RepID=UPI001EF1B7E5|nr:AAA family ATPase [Corynebacterium sp. ACRPH]MCG7457129.1 AAA family ATPase [Corynebacterium sp. ACRPH]